MILDGTLSYRLTLVVFILVCEAALLLLPFFFKSYKYRLFYKAFCQVVAAVLPPRNIWETNWVFKLPFRLKE